LRNAEFMKNDLKVAMPDEIMERMARATTKEGGLAEGLAIAREMLAAVRDQVQGVQVSAPFGKFGAALDVLGLTVEVA
jgi:5,10-methylenetetrahydrofolate reductase